MNKGEQQTVTETAAHPEWPEMIIAAIKALNNRDGSNMTAISKYIRANYNVGDGTDMFLRLSIGKMFSSGVLNQTAVGSGLNASYKLSMRFRTRPSSKM